MIELHPIAQTKSHSLIILGSMLGVYPIQMFRRVITVADNLEKNELFASDIEDLIKLAKLIIDHPEPNDFLKDDVANLIIYLDLKIQKFGSIPKSCGNHTQYLGL